MSRSLADLEPKFRQAVELVLHECLRQGVAMRPFYTLRLPREQAVLWRQSRTQEQVKRKIQELRSGGAEYLASILEDVGPQFGRWATNAIPGYSWHQWKRAIDCYWLVNGRAEWSTRKQSDRNGYKIYASIANKLGLHALGPVIADWPHIQYDKINVGDIYTLREVDQAMRERFEGK